MTGAPDGCVTPLTDRLVCGVVIGLRSSACENDALAVSCDEHVIQIINALYGRLETDTCGAAMGTSPDTECLVDGTRDIVRNLSVQFCSVLLVGCDFLLVLYSGLRYK